VPAIACLPVRVSARIRIDDGEVLAFDVA